MPSTPDWLRIKILYRTNTLSAAVLGLGALAISINTSQRHSISLPEIQGQTDAHSAGSFLPFLLAFYLLYFLSGLLYSLRIPNTIAIYNNRGEFVSSYIADGSKDPADARQEWNEDAVLHPKIRLLICLLFFASLVVLFLSLLHLFQIPPSGFADLRGLFCRPTG